MTVILIFFVLLKKKKNCFTFVLFHEKKHKKTQNIIDLMQQKSENVLWRNKKMTCIRLPLEAFVWLQPSH